jgi:hypothetical protein
MSKLETPMTLRYWERVGGTLCEEFPLVARRVDASGRWADGLIVKGGDFERRKLSPADVEGQDVIVIQTKAMRLGMYLLGQALFSRELAQPMNPRSVHSVAICSRDDAVLRPLAEAHGIEIVIDDGGLL